MEVTFSVMARRRLRRQLGGVRKPAMPGLTRALWIVLYLGIGVGFVGLQGGFSDIEVLRVSIFSKPTSFLFFALNLMIVWVAIKSYTLVRLCLAWLLVGTGLVLVVGSPPDSGSGDSGQLSTGGIPFLPLFDAAVGSSTKQVVIAIVTLVLITITIVLWFGVYYVYPPLVVCMERCSTVRTVWNIALHKRRPNGCSFTYLPAPLASCLPWPFSLCAGQRCVFAYEGELGDDDAGRPVPHGWGTWTDTVRHGERLTGYWERGLPVGPFRSLELRTG
jgi:hypothetical protein